MQLAEMQNIRKATFSQMEMRSDLLLSTLRSCVEAVGVNGAQLWSSPICLYAVVLEGIFRQASEPRHERRVSVLKSRRRRVARR